MDIDKIIQILSEAIEDKDWDVLKELLEELIYEDENPIKEYEQDKDEVIEKQLYNLASQEN